MSAFGVDRKAAPQPRQNLRIHTIGPHGDIVDDANHVRDIYGLVAGDWVLVRPDGYVGAIIATGESEVLVSYLSGVGLALG